MKVLHIILFSKGIKVKISLNYGLFLCVQPWEGPLPFLCSVFIRMLMSKLLKVFYSLYRLIASKPCQNHTCSHMCFKSGVSGHVCGCPTGMELNQDQMTCSGVARSYNIYFADSFSDTVYQLTKFKGQPGFLIRPLAVPSNEKLESPVALDFDPDSKFVYWADIKTKKVTLLNFPSTK